MKTNVKKILKIAVLSIFFIFIIVYAFFRSYNLIFGIKIRDVNIVNGATVTDNVLKVIGIAKNAVKLTLDGREIPIDEEGNFNDTIALLPGYNIITLEAEDKFGYIDEKHYQLIYSNK